MKCPKCGKEIANDSQFCEFCGTKINLVSTKSQSPQSRKLWKILTAILCIIVFGGILYYEHEQAEAARIEARIAQDRAEEEARLRKETEEKINKERERQIKEANEEKERKIRAERERIGALKAQGWVDLGLPSGTLWKIRNEDGGFYNEEEVKKFGRNLPTKRQFEELINSCSWKWNGRGYKIVGPNGESIELQALGAVKCWGEEYLVGTSGFYWSSTHDGPDKEWDLYFSDNRVEMFSDSRCDNGGGGKSVRLVK